MVAQRVPDPTCPACKRPTFQAGDCPECASQYQAIRNAEVAEWRRLAAVAQRAGVRIQVRPGAHTAYEATDALLPGERFTLSAYSCTCSVFARHGRCCHLGLLLSELGWLPSTPCHCGGAGFFLLPGTASSFVRCLCGRRRRLTVPVLPNRQNGEELHRG